MQRGIIAICVLVIALLAGSTCWAECGPPPEDTIIWADAFDTYTPNGVLNGAVTPPPNPTVGNPGWILFTGFENSNQINIADSDGGKAVRVSNFNGSTLDSKVNVNSFGPSWNTANNGNRAKFHFKVRGLTGVGDQFWRVDMKDWVDAGGSYFYIVGSDTDVWPATTTNNQPIAPIGPHMSIADGNWHNVDIIMDTTNDLSYYYFDGGWIWTGTHDGGLNQLNKVRSVNIWQYARSTSPAMQVLLDDMKVTTAYGLPVNNITFPTDGYVFVPTSGIDVTWTRNWSCYEVAATQVVVCTSNDPNGTHVYDSGDVAGANLSHTTGELPYGQHWVFERDKLTGGAYNPWSQGKRFIIPDPCMVNPYVTGPNGAVCAGKPKITFGACPHNTAQVIITSDSNGAHIVYDSGPVYSTVDYLTVGPLANGTYYAWVRVGSGVGWSAWSYPGHPFTVDRACEPVDMRHFDEPDILHTDQPAPNDGFSNRWDDFDDDGFICLYCGVRIFGPICGNYVYLVRDASTGYRSLRPHRVQTIDLDQGVTLMWAGASPHPGGADGGGASWRMCNVWLGDKDASGETHMVSVRTRDDSVGIVCDSVHANQAWGNGFTNAGLPVSTDYRIYRLTGCNANPGDYNSTVWKLYVDENPTPMLTKTGTFPVAAVESEPGLQVQYRECDQIAIGSGSSGLTGDWYFDWIAVNGGGDYAPGQWNPFGDAAYASIGGAKAPGVEIRPVAVSGPSVITRVLTGTVPPLDIGVQLGFYVQDVVIDGMNLSGVKVLTADTKGGTVAVGARLMALSGLMAEKPGGRVIFNAGFEIEGTASVASVAMAQKSMNGPCIGPISDSDFNYTVGNPGGGFDTTGMMVRFFGQCLLSGFDPGWGTAGAYVFYLDDGSGAQDGRELIEGVAVGGIRCLNDASNPMFTPPDVGDYLMVEGIVSYEHAVRAGDPPVDLGNVRTILFPTYTTLATGL